MKLQMANCGMRKGKATTEKQSQQKQKMVPNINLTERTGKIRGQTQSLTCACRECNDEKYYDEL